MAKGKYIVCLDADSSLDRDALEKILLPFYIDGMVKGVGGCVKVRNRQGDHLLFAAGVRIPESDYRWDVS